MNFCDRYFPGKMKLRRRRKPNYSFGVILMLLFFLMHTEGISRQDELILADKLFKEGKFTEAEDVYEKIVKKDPENYGAVLALGRINLYKNSLEESEKWLRKAIELNPEDETPKALLAEAYYRRDNFQEAALLFRDIQKIPMAKKLHYLSAKIPYQIESDVDVTSVEFVQTDPLPMVKMRINNSEEVLFLIDTGGWELIVETEFAAQYGAKKFGGLLATYAGGMQDSTFHGAVEQVEIGDFKIKNVPVHINNSPQSMAAMMGQPIRGVIGTVFLYHFIFTFDYPEGKLILQRKTEENKRKMKNEIRSKDNIIVPFWMSGDHIMVAWGTVNKSKPMLFFVDTGLAGGGFIGTERTIEEANIQLPEESHEGVGGGGKVRIKRAVVDEITLGEAKEKSVVGLFGANPHLDDMLGYRVGGILSHGFFRPYKLTFDFTTMNLILNRKKY